MPQDSEYLGRLRDYYAKHRVIPSFATIAGVVGLSSTSSVAALVGRLKQAGFLRSTPERRLTPGPRFFERDVLDSVRAGLPAAAAETLLQTFTIDEHLIEVPSRTVLLRVRGDSMTEAGLLDGDTVVVLKNAPANPGDVVVAIVDGEYTVKYLALDERGRFYLRAANAKYSNIRPSETLEILGVVVGSFRKYR